MLSPKDGSCGSEEDRGRCVRACVQHTYSLETGEGKGYGGLHVAVSARFLRISFS